MIQLFFFTNEDEARFVLLFVFIVDVTTSCQDFKCIVGVCVPVFEVVAKLAQVELIRTAESVSHGYLETVAEVFVHLSYVAFFRE